MAPLLRRNMPLFPKTLSLLSAISLPVRIETYSYSSLIPSSLKERQVNMTVEVLANTLDL